MDVQLDGRSFKVQLERKEGTNVYVAHIDDRAFGFTVTAVSDQKIRLLVEGEQIEFAIRRSRMEFNRPIERRLSENDVDQLASPMPGRVISVQAKEGSHVEVGDPLVVIESMKMETILRSDRKATVERVEVRAGDSVRRGQPLLKYAGTKEDPASSH